MSEPAAAAPMSAANRADSRADPDALSRARTDPAGTDRNGPPRPARPWPTAIAHWPNASTATTTSTRCCAPARRSADALVREAWARCIPADAPLALFAVGGYGRGELFPQSDIDLLVLAGDLRVRRATQHDALARFFALLWDAGLPVGHAVRSIDECTSAARDDITVLTAQMEARPLAADAAAIRALGEAIAPQRVWPPRDYFLAKREEQRVRHARFGDTADNLEPNLKEGPGGLRDMQTLRWMALRVLGARDLGQLIALGQLGADEFATLERERRALVAPALRPAPGRRASARNACASTTRRRSPPASATSTATTTSPSNR